MDALDGEQVRCGLCGRLDAADVVPCLEGTGAIGAVVGCGHAVAGQEEEVADLVMGGQEALGVPGRLEPLHLEVSNPLAHAALCRMPLPLHAANWAALTADVHGWPFEKRAVDRTANLDLGSRIHILHFSIIIDRAVPGNGLGLELLQAVAPRDGPPL